MQMTEQVKYELSFNQSNDKTTRSIFHALVNDADFALNYSNALTLIARMKRAENTIKLTKELAKNIERDNAQLRCCTTQRKTCACCTIRANQS